MRKTGAIIGSVCTLGALLLIFSEWLGGRPARAGASSEPQIKFQKEPLSREVLARTSFAPVVKRVAPSVVTVYSTKSVKESTRSSPLFEDPFFRRFFGFGDEPDDEDQPPAPRGGRRGPGRRFQEQSLGSGVIVTSDGYILSNNHVVEGRSADRHLGVESRRKRSLTRDHYRQFQLASRRRGARRGQPVWCGPNRHDGNRKCRRSRRIWHCRL